MLARFEFQAEQATIWRDTICNWISDSQAFPTKEARLPTDILVNRSSMTHLVSQAPPCTFLRLPLTFTVPERGISGLCALATTAAQR